MFSSSTLYKSDIVQGTDSTIKTDSLASSEIIGSPNIVKPKDPLFRNLAKILENRPKFTSHFDKTAPESTERSFDAPFQFVCSIKATRNNTHVAIGSRQGKCLVTVSAGFVGLKKSHRGSSDAGYQTALRAAQILKEKYRVASPRVHVILRGFGSGREQALRALIAANWVVRRLTDESPIRYAGCRPRKKRRI